MLVLNFNSLKYTFLDIDFLSNLAYCFIICYNAFLIVSYQFEKNILNNQYDLRPIVLNIKLKLEY